MNLRDYRKAKGHSQPSLAKALGIPIRTIQKYENGESKVGNMTLKLALPLADELGMTMDDFKKIIASEDTTSTH